MERLERRELIGRDVAGGRRGGSWLSVGDAINEANIIFPASPAEKQAWRSCSSVGVKRQKITELCAA